MTPAQDISDFITSCRPEFGPVGDDQPLVSGGILDSMTLYRVVAFLEERWDVRVRDEDLLPMNFDTVAAIARLVDGYRHSTGPLPAAGRD